VVFLFTSLEERNSSEGLAHCGHASVFREASVDTNSLLGFFISETYMDAKPETSYFNTKALIAQHEDNY
jgi:hypothetical protein